MSDAAVADKGDVGPRRTDVEPLTKRFALIGQPTSATWYGGTFGTGRAPGPTSYWIDAVLVLQPSTIEDLLSTYAPTVAEREPDVVAKLADDMPAGDLLASQALDAAASSTGWSVSMWIAPDSQTVILQAVGQGS